MVDKITIVLKATIGARELRHRAGVRFDLLAGLVVALSTARH
jgi:hypothetical protein